MHRPIPQWSSDEKPREKLVLHGIEVLTVLRTLPKDCVVPVFHILAASDTVIAVITW